MKVLSGAAMREVDRVTIEEFGLPGSVLMENAAMRVSEFVMSKLPHAKKIVILAGPGNNGGDGIAVARQLSQAGYSVDLWSTQKAGAYRNEAALNEKFYLKSGRLIKRISSPDDLQAFGEDLDKADILIDALLGTGADRPMDTLTAGLIDRANSAGLPVIALDIPSGVNADSGEILGSAVRADWTLTFAFPKKGLFFYPGAANTGDIYICDIHIPAALADDEKLELLTAAAIKDRLPARPVDAHKGSLGKVLLVAGSPGMTGAACLAAESALKGGAGLVYLAAPASICAALEAKLTEVIVIALPEEKPGEISASAADEIVDSARNCQVLCIGPGLATGEEGTELLNKLIHLSPVPLVLDAGALGALGKNLSILRSARYLPVLTPHPGEMGRLVGLPADQIQSNRLEAALKNAALWNCIILLKGANSIVATPEGEAAINPTGSVTLATAGSGDLLTGLVASFIAQGMEAREAAGAGAFIHGLAADLLPATRGHHARSFLDNYPAAFQYLNNGRENLAVNPYLKKVKPLV